MHGREITSASTLTEPGLRDDEVYVSNTDPPTETLLTFPCTHPLSCISYHHIRYHEPQLLQYSKAVMYVADKYWIKTLAVSEKACNAFLWLGRSLEVLPYLQGPASFSSFAFILRFTLDLPTSFQTSIFIPQVANIIGKFTQLHLGYANCLD